MTYQVRIYCHASFQGSACKHQPQHPYTLPDSFESIRAANDSAGELVTQVQDDEVEWEIVDSSGNVVC